MPSWMPIDAVAMIWPSRSTRKWVIASFSLAVLAIVRMKSATPGSLDQPVTEASTQAARSAGVITRARSDGDEGDTASASSCTSTVLSSIGR